VGTWQIFLRSDATFTLYGNLLHFTGPGMLRGKTANCKLISCMHTVYFTGPGTLRGKTAICNTTYLHWYTSPYLSDIWHPSYVAVLEGFIEC
jgi:hypothetical protein